jgi:aspartate/methionine/tyrosine aminotransferase
MLAINYPNNPSGATLSQAVRDKLRYLVSHGATLFNDATYGPLVYDQAPRSLLSEIFPADNNPKVLELHSFSKLFPIGPLAVSFLAGAPELIQPMAVFKEYSSSPLSRLQLAATAECLKEESRIQQFRDHIPSQLESLQTVLDELGFKTFSANSGTYLLCEVPQSIADQPISSAQGAAKLLMNKFDIAVVPLGTEGRAYLRFSGLYRPDDLDRLAALGPKLLIR